jgi:ribonuclease D
VISLPLAARNPAAVRAFRKPARCRTVEFTTQSTYFLSNTGWRGDHQKGIPVANHLYKNDLPDGLDLGPVVAIDCETMGLNPHRDRLCVIQMSGGDGNAHIVQVAKGQTEAPNLCRMLEDPKVLKLFHFGRFDIAAMYHAFGALTAPVYCTKIASRLVRTYTDRHGLKNLSQELLGIDISKQQQMSDWGAPELTEAQLDYAASDVLHLHRLRNALDKRLAREGRTEIAQACFDFLPTRAKLDLAGWPEIDIFAHS